MQRTGQCAGTHRTLHVLVFQTQITIDKAWSTMDAIKNGTLRYVHVCQYQVGEGGDGLMLLPLLLPPFPLVALAVAPSIAVTALHGTTLFHTNFESHMCT